jgi:HEPN domain-containing protein
MGSERRGVKVVNLPGTREKYGDVLAECFAELREYRREHAGPTLRATEEKPLEQFLLPRDAMSRLCLFATPLDILPFYRENVFPLVEAVGFVPVTAADVVNLGESISAKIDTLIDRAAVMVVDATSSFTQFELGLAISRAQEKSARPNRQPLQIIAVVADFAQLQGPASNIQAIARPLVLSEDNEFVGELAKRLEAIAEEMGLAQRNEPRRLLEAKEYRAAVIAAMTLLELTLRQRFSKKPIETERRTLSMRALLNLATLNGIAPEYYDELLAWTKLRNDAVHTGRRVSRQEAQAVVEGVQRIIDTT